MNNMLIWVEEKSHFYFPAAELVAVNSKFLGLDKSTGKTYIFAGTKPQAKLIPPFVPNLATLSLKDRTTSRFSKLKLNLSGQDLNKFGFFKYQITTDITFNAQRLVKAKKLDLFGNLYAL